MAPPRRKLSPAHKRQLQRGARRGVKRRRWEKRGRLGRGIARTLYRKKTPKRRKTGRRIGGFLRRGKRLSSQHRKRISEGLKKAHKTGRTRRGQPIKKRRPSPTRRPQRQLQRTRRR